ncbi:hypothetical protein DFH94DRAFT_406297 [Russula ochroleuca]|jgi:hypothetical protein|uniref:Uncharacterized protein n=1 Tax=Russula ochroleuca TaxID=152965 RepID=A0A9P5MY71_9AGAM|nr:hypothetical protein DFH94DRAFT_406297 [Russula ochroleuca]
MSQVKTHCRISLPLCQSSIVLIAGASLYITQNASLCKMSNTVTSRTDRQACGSRSIHWLLAVGGDGVGAALRGGVRSVGVLFGVGPRREICAEEAARGSGQCGRASRTGRCIVLVLYVGESRMSGRGMIGTEDVGRSFGSPEKPAAPVTKVGMKKWEYACCSATESVVWDQWDRSAETIPDAVLHQMPGRSISAPPIVLAPSGFTGSKKRVKGTATYRCVTYLTGLLQSQRNPQSSF